jgi:hypothetical protein
MIAGVMTSGLQGFRLYGRGALRPVFVFVFLTWGRALEAQDIDILDDDLFVADAWQESRPERRTLLIPLPNVNPTTGAGIGVLGLVLYQLDPGSPPSSTAPFAQVTSNGTWILGVDQATHLAHDDWRLNGLAAISRLNIDFFGIGTAAGDDGTAIPLGQEGWALAPEVLRRVWGRLYVGVRGELGRVDGVIDEADDALASSLGLGPDQRRVSIAGAGATVEWDTRDRPLNATRGLYVGVRSVWLRPWRDGASSFQAVRIAVNHFVSLGPGLVLASRAQVRSSTGDVPVFFLPSIMDRDDLRGYEGGRFRDRFLVASQAEVRWSAWSRLGLVAFGGFGGVAPSAGRLSTRDLRLAGGVGGRYLVAPSYDVNLSADIAFGKFGPELYVYLAEAF